MKRMFSEFVKRTKVEALGVAMPGARLPDRVRKIIDAAPIARLSFMRAACIVASCGILCAAFFAVTLTLTQAQSSTQTFDVISVKPNRSGGSNLDIHDSSPGTFTATNTTLTGLIEYAYDVTPRRIEGSPGWVGIEKFDIDAKVDDSMTAQERSLPGDQAAQRTRARVQSLLADRFKLQVRHETKEMPVLALVVAKDGPKLVEGKGAPSLSMSANAGQWSLTSKNVPIHILVNALSRQPEIGGRILIDQTGLTGTYVYKLQWTAQNLSAGAASSSDASGPTLFTALQEQLGLRLESTKAPVDVLVVDHVEEPTPN